MSCRHMECKFVLSSSLCWGKTICAKRLRTSHYARELSSSKSIQPRESSFHSWIEKESQADWLVRYRECKCGYFSFITLKTSKIVIRYLLFIRYPKILRYLLFINSIIYFVLDQSCFLANWINLHFFFSFMRFWFHGYTWL